MENVRCFLRSRVGANAFRVCLSNVRSPGGEAAAGQEDSGWAWEECTTDDGDVYYLNHSTGESRWATESGYYE